LPAKFVIHTVGPVYIDGKNNEEKLLRSCYKSSLKIAKERGLKSIAFPLISAGIFGYPMKEAITVAVTESQKFLESANMKILIVLYDIWALKTATGLFPDIKVYKKA